MAKTLKIWNGRGYYDYGRKVEFRHLYVCAHTGAEAVRILQEAGYVGMNYRELKDYWNKDCWGKHMEGITPEKGVWAQRDYHDPVERLL